MAENSESRSVTPAQAVSLYKSILRHGDEAWRKWAELGTWIGERTAMAAVRAHATRGTIYARQLQRALGQFAPIYKQLSDNGTISFLMRCMTNLDTVNAFRNRLPEDDRPSHPRRLWEAYEASLRSTIDISDDGEEDSDESDETKTKPARAHVGRTHNSEKELLAEIERLKEQISEFEMSIYPDMNAERIWRRIVEILGHGDKAGELALKTGEALVALGKRIVESQLEWAAGEPRRD